MYKGTNKKVQIRIDLEKMGYLLCKINEKEKNSITFTTSEWYIDMPLLRSFATGLFDILLQCSRSRFGI
ncbi:MAG: hypothetical protein BGO34_21790 [Bacteroidia bacterium 44-10]|nr:MAG: hypothetical protein BGO34_21790 [Bacteroidia bacterium 44-10]